MIKALIFDFGNVFLNLDIENAKKDIFELLKIDSFSDEMMVTNQLYEKGLVTTDAFLGFYLNTFTQLSKLELINTWNAVLKNFPEDRLKFIQKLASEKKYQLFLLSNTNDLHINWVKDNIPFYETFRSCFDGFYLSHEIGLRKPDKAIFEFVLEKNELKPGECLFIDDTKEHIQGASSLGIHTWRLSPEKDDITNLFITKRHLF